MMRVLGLAFANAVLGCVVAFGVAITDQQYAALALALNTGAAAAEGGYQWWTRRQTKAE